MPCFSVIFLYSSQRQGRGLVPGDFSCLCLCVAVAAVPAHFSRDREPKVLITTCYKPSKGMYAFLAEMLVSRVVLGAAGTLE